MQTAGQRVSYQYAAGSPCPLGAYVDKEKNGVNFSIFSTEADFIQLLLFETPDDTEPFQTIDLNRDDNCDYGFWHVFVENLPVGTNYAYRINGPIGLDQGYRYNFNKVLIDPYTKGVTTNLWNRVDACNPDIDNIASSMRCSVIDVSDYDWENVKKPQTPLNESVIYEMHVKGFTASPSSNIENRGTFLGIIDKIPYLKSLGVTAVELMPVMQFDDNDNNYWGYGTISFFAPHPSYCVSPERANQLNNFRDMVKALHKNGIEVIMDVVYNHTDEGNENGPTINFKGIDNGLYYYIAPDRRYYMNYSGCGNTLSCNHPIVQKMVTESLEFWANDMQVDGFRFDLGSILARDTYGNVMEYPPVLWGIELRESLTDCKLITEPWDAVGLYELGHIHGYRWSQWNGNYRDTIRSFVKGDPGIIGRVATKIAGSPDLFQGNGYLATNGINFITCHDGFTLNDLVSYNYKHNEENGEGNRDGNDNNISWNCGAEGETDDPEINALRTRQIKNFISVLFLSKGVPMMYSGDETRRSQDGNNNGYCLDNEKGWIDWDLLNQNSDIYYFFQKLIRLRRETFFLQTRHFYNGQVSEKHTRGLNDINWHGTILNSPGWNDPNARALAFTIAGVAPDKIYDFEGYPDKDRFIDRDIHVMMNMYWEALDFEIPQVQGRSWYKYADTYETNNETETLYDSNTYNVKPRSIVILISQ